MRNILITTILLAPFSVDAENGEYNRFDSSKMRQVTTQMQTMRDCLKTMHDADMQTFRIQSKKMGAEIKTLCGAGKRDLAMARTKAFAKDISANKAALQMQLCSEGLTQAMPLLLEVSQGQNPNIAPKHVCDE